MPSADGGGARRSKGKSSFRAGGDADDFMEADDSDSSDDEDDQEVEEDSDGAEQLPGVSGRWRALVALTTVYLCRGWL